MFEKNCSPTFPISVQLLPMHPSNSCVWAPPSFNNSGKDVGHIHPSFCDLNMTIPNTQQCLPSGMVFVGGRGGRMAYDFLPDNWTGLCAPAMLITDVDIIPEDEAVSVEKTLKELYK